MKILFDHQAFLAEYNGISNCFAQLIRHLPDDVRWEIGVVDSENHHLKENHLTAVRPYRLRRKNFIREGHFPGKGHLYDLYRRWFPLRTSEGVNEAYTMMLLEKGDIDIFHATFYEPYFLNRLNGTPLVITIHDMNYEKQGKHNAANEWKKLLATKASHIVCVSEATKEDVKDMLHVPEDKMTVIYHGGPDVTGQSREPLFSFPYLLYVGSRNNYKNFWTMMTSIKPVLQQQPDLHVVCTGTDFSVAEHARFKEMGVDDRMVFHHFHNRDLTGLYGHARCFIYPSLQEGFGIPILEAYAAGCPVLLNRTTCFPEIAQDAAVFFDLYDGQDNLTTTLADFMTWTPQQREDLLERQRQRLACFSWEKSALELKKVYERVLAEHSKH